MFTKLISGGASLLVQVIFVVAVVLLFMWWDPLGILLPTKRTLKDTPVQVESIKKLGELITAEYYGEVVASLGEVKDSIKTEKLDTIIETTEDLHEDFQEAIEELLSIDDDRIKARKFYEVYREEFKDLVEHPDYPVYANYIYEKIKDRSYRRNDLDKVLSERKERKLIRKLANEKSGWKQALDGISTDEFIEVNKHEIDQTYKKTFKKARLAMIGRGWVKAGFDFEEFDQSNFRYDERNKVIHFIGVEPKIISATINPWFIPEEQVEGFEFLIVEKQAKRKTEYTNMVKQLCLDKLSAQAYDKEILEKAQENAETNLKGFFSLLLGEDITKVSFHADILSSSLESLLLDSIVSNEEIFFADRTLETYYSENKDNSSCIPRMAEFVRTLKNAGYQVFDASTDLNAKSSLLMSVLEDRVITKAEMDSVEKRLAVTTQLDFLWNVEIAAAADSALEKAIADSVGLKQRINGEDEETIERLREGSMKKVGSQLDKIIKEENGNFREDLEMMIDSDPTINDQRIQPIPIDSNTVAIRN